MDRSLTVVVPTKDRLRALRQTLPGYLSQPEVDEVVVVVNGSADGTLPYLDELRVFEPRLRVVDNGRNRGLPFSKNAGIDAAASAFVFIAEDDLEVTPGFFGTLLSHLHGSGADIACGREVWRFDGEPADQALARADQLQGPYVQPHRMTIQTGRRLPEDSTQLMLAAPMLGRTEVFRRVRFDERFRVNHFREETDFQFTAQELGYKLLYCPHATCFNFIYDSDRGGTHADGGARRAWWTARNDFSLLRKHQRFIQQHFMIGHPLLHVARGVGRRAFWEEIEPRLQEVRESIRRSPRTALGRGGGA